MRPTFGTSASPPPNGPQPISANFDTGTSIGTIVFDQNVNDAESAGNPIWRGILGNRHNATEAFPDGSPTVTFDTAFGGAAAGTSRVSFTPSPGNFIIGPGPTPSVGWTNFPSTVT